ncbi:MAG TPA: GNAT family N-acetyltransferase [Bauldia sp.]|nr:GNAT family N-acetyltransferase [Bauldia sp.]
MRDGETEEAWSFRETIATPRLNLRRPDAGDQATLRAIAANRRIAESLAASPCANGNVALAIVERASGSVIGGAGMVPLADRAATAEIGAFLAESWWGKGYGTEAIQSLVEHVFADGRFVTIWAACRATNPSARRVMEKCGFQFRGAGMVRAPAPVGAVPVERYMLDRRNWESLMAWGAALRGRRASDVSRTHDAA